MEYMLENPECSSGCESGWTLYLDHSSVSPYGSYNIQENNDYLDGRRSRVFGTQVKGLEQEEEGTEEEEEDEDLSMVSDASSGPPHFHEEEGYGGGNEDSSYQNDAALCRNRHKSKDNRRRRKAHQDRSNSLLDDTASSPLFDFSNKNFLLTRSQPSAENVLEYSQGYSSTQFEVRRPYQEHYDFFQSSPSGNQLQQNQWFEGKRW